VTSTYDSSPAAAHRPLSADDVANLLATDAADALSTPVRVRTLLARLAATMDAHAVALGDLHRSVAEVAGSARAAASPMGAALSALGALDEAGQRAMYDIRASALLDGVDEATEGADRALAAARNESLRNRFILAQLMESPDLPEAAKAALHAAMMALAPADAPMVSVDTVRLSALVAAAVAAGGFTVSPRLPEPGWDDVFGDEPGPPAS